MRRPIPRHRQALDRVDLRTTRWTISCYKDLPERQTRFDAYAIDPALVDYRLRTEF